MKLFGPYTLLIAVASTQSSAAQSANDIAAQALAQAKTVIAGMVQANSKLTPEFIRMGFHDCVGGCDGKSLDPLELKFRLRLTQNALTPP